MTDALFNTLLAALSICSNHAESGTLSLDMVQQPGAHYEKGFERCEDVAQAIKEEQRRRAADVIELKRVEDAVILANALSGLHGKAYTEQAKPPPPSNLWGGCVVPTNTYVAH